MILNQILDKIKEYQNITIFRHVRPDGDAYGSQIGLKHIILENFPDKKIKCLGEGSNIFEKLLDPMDTEVSDEFIASSLAIVLDTPNESRVDDNRYKLAKESIKIDHHIKVDEFANIEWIDTSSIATSQLVSEFVYELNLKLNKQAAEALYLGIVTDSGRFLFSNVSIKTFEMVTFLLNYDVDLNKIYSVLYTQKENEVRFRGYCQLNFNITPHGVAYMKIGKDKIDEFHITPSHAAGIVNVLSNIEDCEIHVHFAEDYDGRIRTEFRSKRIPVNFIASKYGGGGHALASGAILNNWEEVDHVLKDLDELCKRGGL